MSDKCTLVLSYTGVSRGVVSVIASPTFIGSTRNFTGYQRVLRRPEDAMFFT